MTLNEKLVFDKDGQLRTQENESFILEQKDIYFEVNIDKLGKHKGQCRLLMTTQRIILITDNIKKKGKKYFDIPLNLICKEKLQQPIFGSNYFTGMTAKWPSDAVLTSAQLPSDSVFKIWFMKADSTNFLKAVRFCLK